MGKRGRVAIALLTVLVAAAVVGRVTFERRISREIEEFLRASAEGAPAVVTAADLTGLPEPVQRWLRWAQVVGREVPATVRLTQEGRFRQSEGAAWMPFTAEEYFTTSPPGFIWKTSMAMLPGVSIIGRDRYVDGRGSIEMRALGLVPVANASGPAMDQGALLRYLNEMLWFPQAALSSAITWEPVGATSAKATMTYAGVTTSAIFVFDEEGKPVDMVAERQDLARGRLETWSTPMSAYGEFEGVRIPVAGRGVWRYDTGDFPYIELRITALEYDPALE
jgi:hypothetical protein